MAKEKTLARGTYRAERVSGGVILYAEGMTPTPNYTVWLERSMIDVFPPEYVAWWQAPEGIQMQMLEPYTAQVIIRTEAPLDTVIVRDADGEHLVTVGNPAE